jgi:hypothetical protein
MPIRDLLFSTLVPFTSASSGGSDRGLDECDGGLVGIILLFARAIVVLKRLMRPAVGTLCELTCEVLGVAGDNDGELRT